MSERPTGTVTFLFTDIEGSTRLWQQDQTAMATALARHDALLHETIAAHGGFVFKTVGDAFCAAFATAPDALAAALAAQRALAWKDELRIRKDEEQSATSDPASCILPNSSLPLRVRMALHTGSAVERDGDYFGPTLNRVARILSAGHGGQVLLSQVTYELVRDALPPGVGLRDMGECRLKDLIRPERLFQVDALDLPSTFPLLKTLDAHANNLPTQPTLLLNREAELAQLARWLARPDMRLMTLTGVGGSGKTRLALQVAADHLDEFSDGAYFVDLAPLRDPALVASTIATTLGVRETGGRPLVDTLIDALREKHMLLVLDNFEQVVAAAPVVATLLAAAAGLRVLVTSRSALHLRGEQECPVPPLALPDMKHLPTPEKLTHYAAVELFIQRAVNVKPDFAVTNANAPAVAEICHHLDGLPLAIELAAARVKLFSPQALLARLGSRLKTLSTGPRDVPARQQTLRSAIAWSYDLLDEAEQTLFRRLGGFVGGFTLEAAEAVCNADGDLAVDVVEGVASLVDKSLVQQGEGLGGEPRLAMLETIHEFAVERLRESADADGVAAAHARFCVGLAETAEGYLMGLEEGVWFERLEAEHDNLRAALTWAAERGDRALGLQLAAALGWFWTWCGHLREGHAWLERFSGDAAAVPPPVRAKAASVAGTLECHLGHPTAATAQHAEALALYRAVGDRRGEAISLSNLGAQAMEQGDYPRAQALLEESVTLLREWEADAALVDVLCALGETARLQGDDRRARAYYEESLGLARHFGHRWTLALLLANLGFVALHERDARRAEVLLREALDVSREVRGTYSLAEGLVGMAGVSLADGQPERCLRLLGAADTVLAVAGHPLQSADAAEYRWIVAGARQAVGEERANTVQGEGRAMTSDEALAYALEMRVDQDQAAGDI